jgi:23S rRNA-/tRNA-specific pseudouridylate synthase
VVEPLADGAAALVQWQLDTGRTHQIRVHAKHLGHPLFCDDTYGGGGGSAVSALGRGKAARCALPAGARRWTHLLCTLAPTAEALVSVL